MQITLPQLTLPLRLVLWAYGGLILFWLTLEENSVIGVTLLALGASLLSLLVNVVRRWGGHRISAQTFVGLSCLAGALIGGGTSLGAALLMFFKTAWHSHVFPDYPVPLMLAMLERLPVWMIAGVLLGAAYSLLMLVFYGVSSDRSEGQ